MQAIIKTIVLYEIFYSIKSIPKYTPTTPSTLATSPPSSQQLSKTLTTPTVGTEYGQPPGATTILARDLHEQLIIYI